MGASRSGWWSYTSSPLLLLCFFFLLGIVTAQGTSGENPITYPLKGVVGGSGTIDIAWKPTTSGTVTIELLKGPQTNLANLGPIYASGPNSGSFSWSVPDTLESYESMEKNHIYGFKIIDDLTGKFEYSNPFSIEVPNSKFGASSNDSKESKPTAAPQPSAAPNPTKPTKPETPEEGDEPAAEIQIAEAELSELPIEAFREVVTVTAAMPTATATTSSTSSSTPLPEDDEPVNIFAIAGGAIAAVAFLIVGVILFIRLRKDKELIANHQAKTERRAIEPDPETGAGTGAQLKETNGHRRFNSTSSFGDVRRASEEFQSRDVLRPKIGETGHGAPPFTGQVNFPPVAAAAVPVHQQKPPHQQRQPQPQQQYTQHHQLQQYPQRPAQPHQAPHPQQWQGGQQAYGGAVAGRPPPPQGQRGLPLPQGQRGPPLQGQHGPPPQGQRGPPPQAYPRGPAPNSRPPQHAQQPYPPRGPPAAYNPQYQHFNSHDQKWPIT